MKPDTSSYNLFCKSSLFQGLKEKELQSLFSVSKEVAVEPGGYLVREGEKANELFIVTEGTMQVLKHDPVIHHLHVIDEVHAGDTLGEISLLDHGSRSASVRAVTFSRLRSISFEDLHHLINTNKELVHLFFRLSENISIKLRRSNEIALRALRKEAEGYRTRSDMGSFLICIVTALSLFTYAMSSLQYLLKIVPNSTYVTFPLTFSMGLFLLFLIHFYNFDLSDVGITSKNWVRSAMEGFFFTVPCIALIGFSLKWFLMRYSVYFAGRPFFDPFALIRDPEERTWLYWIGLNVIYCLILVPIQELLTRGALQGLLEKFLLGKHRVLLSILASNLIFSSAHVYFSVYIASLVFFTGCFIGWLYTRTHNLLGCCISHAIVGVLGLSVLGIVGAPYQ